jgi:hypothetical protein
MDETLGYPPGLLTMLGLDPERLRRQQVTGGLLSAGLQALAASGPSRMPTSAGQIIGQAGMAGLQGYQQAGESAIERAIKGLQVSDVIRKQQEAQKVRNLAGQLYRTDQTPLTSTDVEAQAGGFYGQPGVNAPQTRQVLNRNVMNQLMQLPGGPEYLANVAKTQDLFVQKPQVVAPGSVGYVLDPETGSYKVAFEGAPKDMLSGDALNVARLEKLPADPSQWTTEQQNRFNRRYAELKNIQAQDPTRMLLARDEIRTKWLKEIEPEGQVAQRFKTLSASVVNPTPVGDTAIIYSFAKILNPGEAIMEGDIRNILANRSVPDKIKQAAERVISGKNLTEDERIEIQTIAYRIARDRKTETDKSYSNRVETLTKLGETVPSAVISNPYEGLQKPPIISVQFKGKKTRARLSPKDGKYYVQAGNEFYEVSE